VLADLLFQNSFLGAIRDQRVVAHEARIVVVDRNDADFETGVGSVNPLPVGVEGDLPQQQHLTISFLQMRLFLIGKKRMPIAPSEILNFSGENFGHSDPGYAALYVLDRDIFRVQLVV